jgi:hypothetical protein
MKDDLTIGASDSNRAILIRVNNIPSLVASKGAIASLLQSNAPGTMEATVYDKMAGEMKKGLRAQGVDADVQVVEPSGWKSAGGGPIWKPLAIGLGATTLGLLMWKIFGGRKS